MATLREQAREKLAQRARIIEENRQAINAAEKEKRDRTGEELAASEKRWADINRLKHGAMSTKVIIDATKPAPPTDFPKRALVPAEVVEKMKPEEYLEPLGR